MAPGAAPPHTLIIAPCSLWQPQAALIARWLYEPGLPAAPRDAPLIACGSGGAWVFHAHQGCAGRRGHPQGRSEAEDRAQRG